MIVNTMLLLIITIMMIIVLFLAYCCSDDNLNSRCRVVGQKHFGRPVTRKQACRVRLCTVLNWLHRT
jgi:hypothetical protein